MKKKMEEDSRSEKVRLLSMEYIKKILCIFKDNEEEASIRMNAIADALIFLLASQVHVMEPEEKNQSVVMQIHIIEMKRILNALNQQK